ncbi:hypothetical protein CNMCM5793_000203 [Aspergillus hiratsukae]|uniref:Uncharacterized protein n=1 Tax=Aspergillus hiratsukae TaxID=1194566 RepID=A0A8H6P9D7_9EURO|nr:hypothetical protein CNMCM5793_000203 [Aspergillus hiratsukae]KAF7164045.1 hypothetical protein CNMCM6106_000739 [Aspergillus hiratsukae]
MKFFNILSLSVFLALATAAAVPGVEGTTKNVASPLDNRDTNRDHCGQVCFNYQECSGKCSRCDQRSLVCKKP